MPDTPLALAGPAAIFLVCGFAIFAGSWRERMGGLALLLDHVLNFLLGLGLLKLTILRFLPGDAFCLVGFFYLCWKAPHPWPLWAFGLQFCRVMTEIAALCLGPSLMEWTFLTIVSAIGYCILVVLLIGTFAALHTRRLLRQEKA